MIEINDAEVQRAVAAILKNEKLLKAVDTVNKDKGVASFGKIALPLIRSGWGGKEVEVTEQVGVQLEELPAAGPGEIQVGEGDGPQETPIFQTTKKTVSFADSIVNDLVSVQPMSPKLLKHAFPYKIKDSPVLISSS